MGATVKLKGFTDEVLFTLATDPAWAVTMSIMTANELINGKVNRIRDGTVNLPLDKYDLVQVEDLLGKGLQLVGLLKVVAEMTPAKSLTDVPAYIDDRDYPIFDTRQAKDKDGKLIFEVLVDTNSGEESQGKAIMESFDTGKTKKKLWEEISSPRVRNDNNTVIVFPSLTLEQYNKLKSETGITIRSLKEWEVLKVDVSPTGYNKFIEV